VVKLQAFIQGTAERDPSEVKPVPRTRVAFVMPIRRAGTPVLTLSYRGHSASQTRVTPGRLAGAPLPKGYAFALSPGPRFRCLDRVRKRHADRKTENADGEFYRSRRSGNLGRSGHGKILDGAL